MPTEPLLETDIRPRAVARLDTCRRWLLERFDHALQSMLERADRTLYTLCESESESDDPLRPAYFDLMRSLRLQHERLHGATHAELSVRLGAVLAGHQLAPPRHAGRDLLLEETLAINAMATRVHLACDAAADEPGRRIAELMTAAQIDISKEVPLGELLEPSIFCAALHGAVHSVPLDVTAKAVLLKLLERHMAPELLSLYGELNTALDEIIGARSPAPARGATPGNGGPGASSIQSVLKRLIRQSPEDRMERGGGWQLRDELVAKRAALRQHLSAGLPWPAELLQPASASPLQALPSHILAAEALVDIACARAATTAATPSASDAAVEACVRIAMLLLALKDASAVLEPRHPARDVLLLVKEFIGRSDTDTSEASILAVCTELLCDQPDLKSVRSQLRALIEPPPSQVVPASVNLARANEFAERELSRRLAAAPVPVMVKRFALDYWKGLVVTEHVQHGERSSACQQSLETIDLLLWSLAPKHEADEREQLIGALPQLLDSLERGMERIGMPEHSRGELIASLAAGHADIIRGQPPSPTLHEAHAQPAPLAKPDSARSPNTVIRADRRKGDPAELMAKAMKRANLHIFKTARNQSSCKGIQSSLACVWFQARQVTLAKAGSASLFRLRGNTLEALLEPAHAAQDTVPLGKHSELVPRVATSAATAGETFIVCTDGLTSVLSSEELSAFCTQHAGAASEAADAMLKTAIHKGLKDNASVVVVHTREDQNGSLVVESASASGRGAERDYDQEATINDNFNRFALVCDGFGGTRSGHIASGIAACSVSEDLSKATRRFDLEPATANVLPAQELAPWDDATMDREAHLFAPYVANDTNTTTAEQTTLKLATALRQ